MRPSHCRRACRRGGLTAPAPENLVRAMLNGTSRTARRLRYALVRGAVLIGAVGILAGAIPRPLSRTVDRAGCRKQSARHGHRADRRDHDDD